MASFCVEGDEHADSIEGSQCHDRLNEGLEIFQASLCFMRPFKLLFGRISHKALSDILCVFIDITGATAA